MSKVIGAPVEFAQLENEDFDVLARYEKDDVLHYVPIQLKEWVPETLNAKATLEEELAKVAAKYVDDAKRLTVAFHLNRNTTIVFSELQLPPLKLGALWFFGAKDHTQREWWLMGNLLRPGAAAHDFVHPGAEGPC